MKRIFTTLFFCFFFFISYTQIEIDPFSNQSSDKFEYIELVDWNKALSQKQFLFLRTGKMNGKNPMVEMETFFKGDQKAENYIEAINLLGEYGWELISSHVDTQGNTLAQRLTLFKRKVK